MKTYVYVDGFNLYYGCLKGTSHRWLDVKALTEKLIKPEHDIRCIKYFTAKVSSLPNKPDAPVRQEAYLRALRSLPEVEVFFGHFLTNTVWRMKADGSGKVRVLRTEEKGSDVNLATHLVADALRGRFDAAIVISNDSDLCEPIRILAQEERITVGVLMPVARRGRRPSHDLKGVATFWKPIRTGPVKDSQFPDTVNVDGQRVHRPNRWK